MSNKKVIADPTTISLLMLSKDFKHKKGDIESHKRVHYVGTYKGLKVYREMLRTTLPDIS